MSTNPELELAFEFVSQTNRHVFLTGKAGTGKTTFLHRVRKEVVKRMAVVAPTGVAAINAKGVTIHSLLQLPFGVLSEEKLRETLRTRRYSGKKLDLIRNLDLLIIDEISMVRADVLDAIDTVLRDLRRSSKPFGGLQLLMIGDLHQLSPVVKNTEGSELRERYKTPYFFGARVFQEAPPRVVQLKHIYRQKDERFIHLLNEVRHNRMTEDVLRMLNARFQPDLSPTEAAGYITLTSHNNSANNINAEHLRRLETPLHHFRAEVKDKFPESMYPNTPQLSFRVGAQVMFNKNDTVDQLYYNGKIGRIARIEEDKITVSCPGEEIAITVEPVTWENRKYSVDPTTKDVTEETVGSYTQHPLRLAWAITIHKSQGLTFDRVIIDAAAAFAHGQVYVALSRCRTLEGILLHSRIGQDSVRTDGTVSRYTQRAEDNPPTAHELWTDKQAFQHECLREAFNFNRLGQQGGLLRRVLLEHERSISGSGTEAFLRLKNELEDKLIAIGKGFHPQLFEYARLDTFLVDQPELATRLTAAAGYFLPLIRDHFRPGMDKLELLSDNEKVRQQLKDRVGDIRLELFTKQRVFEVIAGGFSTEAYLRARSGAALDFATANRGRKKKKVTLGEGTPNRALVQTLIDWRRKVADAQNISAFKVLSSRSLLEISERLPTSRTTLLQISGFGSKGYASYGEQILTIVQEYVADNKLEGDLFTLSPPKISTRQVSLNLYEQDKTIAEIAAERELTEGTIFGHLATFVKTGILAADRLVPRTDLDKIAVVLSAHPEASFTDIRKLLKEEFDFGPIRVARAELDLKAKKSAAKTT